MEDCTGGDLSGYIKRRGRVESLRYIPEPGAAPIYYPHPRTGGLDIVAVRSFLRQMGRALKFLRQRNLIHRDIKPQNLLLKPATSADHEKGHPLGIPILKIADFGFARHLPNTMLAETLCGSPLYMAPEILRYEKYGSQADLWSVGAVLYEISVGKPPFRAQNHIELLKRIEQARSTVKFPDEEEGSTLTPVPPDIKKLIRALLKRHPVERVTFEEFFVSKAMANSKFHAPKSIEDGNYVGSPSSYSPKSIGTMTPLTNGNSKLPPPVMIPHIPENHRIIPPEVLDPQALVPPSNFNFRKAPNGTSHVGSQVGSSVPASSSNGAPVPHPSSSPAARPSPLRRPVSLTPELPTPAEADEESFLKSDYVVIGDTRHVEFNQRVDELTAARQRTIRRASATPSEKISSTSSPSSSPAQQPQQQQQPALADNGKGLTSSPRKPMLIGLPSNDKFTFPPAPIEGVNAEGQTRTRPPPPRTGSSALSRALNLASKKIWGTGTSASSSHASTNPHSPTLVSSPSPAGYPPTPSSLGSATTAVGSTPNTVTPVPL
ncbi:Serine/threonine-protein kinase, partial [Serendipita sp. 400]